MESSVSNVYVDSNDLHIYRNSSIVGLLPLSSIFIGPDSGVNNQLFEVFITF